MVKFGIIECRILHKGEEKKKRTTNQWIRLLMSPLPYKYQIAQSSINSGFYNLKFSLHLLRGIVNHSNGKSLVDSERNMKDNRLSGTNRYEVLENYDEVENAEIGTKSTT